MRVMALFLRSLLPTALSWCFGCLDLVSFGFCVCRAFHGDLFHARRDTFKELRQEADACKSAEDVSFLGTFVMQFLRRCTSFSFQDLEIFMKTSGSANVAPEDQEVLLHPLLFSLWTFAPHMFRMNGLMPVVGFSFPSCMCQCVGQYYFFLPVREDSLCFGIVCGCYVFFPPNLMDGPPLRLLWCSLAGVRKRGLRSGVWQPFFQGGMTAENIFASGLVNFQEFSSDEWVCCWSLHDRRTKADPHLYRVGFLLISLSPSVFFRGFQSRALAILASSSSVSGCSCCSLLAGGENFRPLHLCSGGVFSGQCNACSGRKQVCVLFWWIVPLEVQ